MQESFGGKTFMLTSMSKISTIMHMTLNSIMIKHRCVRMPPSFSLRNSYTPFASFIDPGV